MKKFFRFIVLALFVVCPLRVHAMSAVQAGLLAAIEGTTAATLALQTIEFANQLKEMADTAKNTLAQLWEAKAAADRAIKNIRSVGDIRSIDDFIKWHNRQLYLEREVEYRYDKASVKIGKNTYKLHEIDEVPNAIRNSFRDTFDGDFTEEEKRDLFISLGLAPSNYAYLKTWEERNNKIAKRILTYSDVFAEEHDEAAARNQNIMDKYRVSGDDLDINEITKEAHITAMNTEMAIREQTRLMVEMHDYQLSRDKMNERLPSPPRRSDSWGDDPFGSITAGHGSSSYEGW